MKTEQMVEKLPNGDMRVTWTLPPMLPDEVPSPIVIVITNKGTATVNGQPVAQLDAKAAPATQESPQ